MNAKVVPQTSGVYSTELPRRRILGMRVDATTYAEATSLIMRWSQAKQPRYVCIANVHMAMEAYDTPAFADLVNRADLVTADGMPLVWALKRLGIRNAQRVCGPDLMPHVLRAAAEGGIPIGLYGGASPGFLERLVDVIRQEFAGIQVAYATSPPFKDLSPEEDAHVVEQIRSSGARVLFVGLGCPKQERWMAAHMDQLDCTMLGVGAAFDFLAGIKPMAPDWMRRLGLEWLYRLANEPRRLWKRYLKQNPRFIALIAMQLAHLRKY
jgi:N-acetylglucosaminyldiphosphoundecaprenol N-acetyl-beta-D-mannosaminyltransferase